MGSIVIGDKSPRLHKPAVLIRNVEALAFHEVVVVVAENALGFRVAEEVLVAVIYFWVAFGRGGVWNEAFFTAEALQFELVREETVFDGVL